MDFPYWVDGQLHRAGSTASGTPDDLLQGQPQPPPLFLEEGITVATRN